MFNPHLPEPGASRLVDARETRSRHPACPVCGQSKRPRRPRRETTLEKKFSAMVAQVNAYPKWAKEFGMEALGHAWKVHLVSARVVDTMVDTCRAEPWAASWAEIGEKTGMTRQAAQQRWGALGGARRPGGQPSNLR